MAAPQETGQSIMSSTADSNPPDNNATSSLAVEMSELNTIPPPAGASQQEAEDTTAGAEQTEAASQPTALPTQQTTSPTTLSTATKPPPATRKFSEALGPATDQPIAAPPSTSAAGPTLSITLMLTSGARHPYKIDEKYLRNRKVEGVAAADGAFDPREISGYKLKELIWTDWRTEWEPRPVSPSSIRLIILGRLLEDKSALKDFPFKLDDTNVVHMTVKPADFLDDDDTGKGTGKGHSIRGRDGEERGAGCRCVIL